MGSSEERVVVTGVAGLIGSHVAAKFRDNGVFVVGCDSFITGQRRNLPLGIEFVEADCRDLDAMLRVCAGATVLIHCAAAAYEGLSVYSPVFVSEHTFGGSAAVFTAAIASGVQRLLFTSSMARYGRASVPFGEGQPPAPVDPYGVAKVAAEMLLRSLCELHEREFVICVPHNVIGPGQRYDDAYRNVAAIMINRLLAGDDVIVYGDGEQRRCFTHVDDVTEQILALAFAPAVSGQVFNLGGDSGFITINALARRILERLRPGASPRYLPPRVGEVRDATCSHERIEAFMGRRSTRTLDQALDALIDEVRLHGARPVRPDVPIEIPDPRIPETWLPEPRPERLRRPA